MWTRSGLDGGNGKGEVEASPEILAKERGCLMSHRFTHRSNENPRGTGVAIYPSQAHAMLKLVGKFASRE